MSSWMLREKNSEEELTEIRIPGWTGRETFLGLLDNIHFCTHFPDSVTPLPWWRRSAMWWRPEVRSTCHPLAQSIFLKHHWRLARQDHKEKYVCVSLFLISGVVYVHVWVVVCMCVCRPEDNSEYYLYCFLFSDRISNWVHRCSYER